MIRKLPHLILILWLPLSLWANHRKEHLNDLISINDKATTPAEKVDSYLNLASFYRFMESNEQRADSFYFLAIAEADMTSNDDLIFQANKRYIDEIPLQYDNDACLIACEKLIQLAADYPKPGRMFSAYLSTGKACLKSLKCDDAVKYAAIAMEKALSNDKIHQIIEARLLFGAALTESGSIEDAFKQLTQANLLIEDLGITDENEKLSFRHTYNGFQYELYKKLDKPESAIEYKKTQIDFVKKMDHIDSVELMFHQLDLVYMFSKTGSKLPLGSRFEEILEFANRKSNAILLDYTLSRYRGWLIESLNFKELENLMLERFPEAIDGDKVNLIMAYVHQGRENHDSVEMYFQKDIKKMLSQENQNFYAIAHTHKRFGEFYFRNNQFAKAKSQFNTSIDYANKVSSSNKILEELYAALEQITKSEGDYEKAYYYSLFKDSLKDMREEFQYQNNLTELEILSEVERQKRIQEIEEEEKRKKHQGQYFWIVIIIILGVLGLIAVSSMAVPEWLIEMLAFFSILSVFEFFVLLLDSPINQLTGGEPIKVFAVKLFMFSILFPLHHIIENTVTAYLKKNKLLINKSGFTFKKLLTALWPWMRGSASKTEHA